MPNGTEQEDKSYMFSCNFGYHLREFSHLFDLGGGVHLLTRWTFDGISILSKSSVMLMMSLMASHILVGEVVKFLALFSRLCEGKIEPNRDEGGKKKDFRRCVNLTKSAAALSQVVSFYKMNFILSVKQFSLLRSKDSLMQYFTSSAC